MAEGAPEAIAEMHEHTKTVIECLKKELGWVRIPHYSFERKRLHMDDLCKVAKLDPVTITAHAPKKRTAELLRTIWDKGGRFRLLFFLFLLAPTSVQMLGLKAVIEEYQYILIWWEKEPDVRVLQVEYEKLSNTNYFEGLPQRDLVPQVYENLVVSETDVRVPQVEYENLDFTVVSKTDLMDFLQYYVTGGMVKLYFLEDGSLKANLADQVGFFAQLKINSASWIQYQVMKDASNLY